MASKKEIKTDVNYLTNEVLVDGIMMMSLYENKQEDIMKHLEKVAEKRNQFVFAIQNPDNKRQPMAKGERGKTRAARTKAFKAMVDEKFKNFATALDATYEYLGTLAAEEK